MYKIYPIHRNFISGRHVICSGFTLIEIVMVLMLSSLLMAATLKGQGMVEQARAKRLESDFRIIPTLIMTYQDRFKALPGDDANANSHLSMPDGFQGNANGVIDGNWFDEGESSEAAGMWRHLSRAGLLSEGTFSSASGAGPENALGQRLGVQNGGGVNSPIVDVSGRGLRGSYVVCSAGIPGDLALHLDIALDDGNPAAGTMLVALDNGAPYHEGLPAATVASGIGSDIRNEKHYIVCMSV